MHLAIYSSQGFILIFVIVLFSFPLMLFSQENEQSPGEVREQVAFEHINALKNGTLVVRLPTHHKKMAAMEELIESEKVSEKNKKRLQSQLRDLKAETKAHNQSIMQAFKENFTFVEVRFIHDTSTLALIQNQEAGIYLNEEEQPIPNSQIKEGGFLLLRLGKAKMDGQSRLDALVFMDQEGKDLEKPFPYYMKINTFSYIVDQVFYPSAAFDKNIRSRVKKLNARLAEFYKKAQD